jgi:hypothetical protein
MRQTELHDLNHLKPEQPGGHNSQIRQDYPL